VHKAFGKGTVVKMTPMGGDHLIEISFDSVGSKKLMLKAAAKFLQTEE
jgi:DNA helicase-2/ATP-dependent DNA helicase PcrA